MLSYTKQRPLDTADSDSTDYAELYDYITEKICESGEEEDKVCCAKDELEVGRLSRRQEKSWKWLKQHNFYI